VAIWQKAKRRKDAAVKISLCLFCKHFEGVIKHESKMHILRERVGIHKEQRKAALPVMQADLQGIQERAEDEIL